MCHLIGSLWNIVSVIEYKFLNHKDTWLHKTDLIDKPVNVVYAESLYWAVATVMLIGSKGETFIETVFTTTTLFVTVGMFAYIISTISMILEDMNKDSQEYKKDLEALNRYMRQKKLKTELQQKIRGFIEYIHQDSQEIKATIAANEVLQKFPKQFRDEIIIDINHTELDNFNFIVDNFSKKTQDRVKKIMEEKSFVTNEKLLCEQEENEMTIHLITKGAGIYLSIQQLDSKMKLNNIYLVELYYGVDENKSFSIGTLREGNLIGDISFITGQEQYFYAKTLSFVSTCAIKRKDFLDILHENQDDLEKFQVLKYNMIFDGMSNLYKRQCKICNRETHTEINCNQINYNPNKTMVYLKSVHSQEIKDRQIYLRNNQRGKCQSLNSNLMDFFYDIIEKLENDEAYLEYCEQFQENDSDYDTDYDEYFNNQGSGIAGDVFGSSSRQIKKPIDTSLQMQNEEYMYSNLASIEEKNESVRSRVYSGSGSQRYVKQTNHSSYYRNQKKKEQKSEEMMKTSIEDSSMLSSLTSDQSSQSPDEIIQNDTQKKASSSSRNMEDKGGKKNKKNGVVSNQQSKNMSCKDISSPKSLKEQVSLVKSQTIGVQKNNEQSVNHSNLQTFWQKFDADINQKKESFSYKRESYQKFSPLNNNSNNNILNGKRKFSIESPMKKKMLVVRRQSILNKLTGLQQNEIMGLLHRVDNTNGNQSNNKISKPQQKDPLSILKKYNNYGGAINEDSNEKSQVKRRQSGKRITMIGGYDPVECRVKQMIFQNQNEWLFNNFEKQYNWKIFFPHCNLISITQKYIHKQKKHLINQNHNKGRKNTNKGSKLQSIKQQRKLS